MKSIVICDCVISVHGESKIRTPNPDCPVHGRTVDPHKNEPRPSLTYNPFANIGASFKAKA